MHAEQSHAVLERVRQRWSAQLRLPQATPALAPVSHGRVVEAVGTLVRATGVRARVGELCALSDLHTGYDGLAEVVGLVGSDLWLSPMGNLQGISAATRVAASGREHSVAVGDFLLGRVVDGMGMAFIDEGPAMPPQATRKPVFVRAPAALSRPPIQQPIDLGVRALDGLLRIGVGQRVGIFAPAGCGKSTLLAMLCRNAAVDITIVALVGERGREVADFLNDGLDEASRKKSVMVVATSDCPASERLKAAFVATAYAEHFRAQGKSVLLLVDSVTRLARAVREIGLAAGEPPTRRGFPPSVFVTLPRLFERAGLADGGSITAFYTVLEETDDGNDPIGEEVRSLLDGSIVLSRKLAQRGHFPAIDVLGSVSRLMPRLVEREHEELARRARELMGKYDDVELLLRIGEYRRGVDSAADAAIDCHLALEGYLRQDRHERTAVHSSVRQLREALL